MPRKTLIIDSVLGGTSETQYNGSKGSYNVGLGIDPDFALSDPDNSGAITAGVRASGFIMPTRYEKFSGSNVMSYPMWLLSNPKNTNIYALTNDGYMLRYNSSLASETVIDSSNISFDAVSGGSFSAATSKTVAHTATGSNLVAVVALHTENAVTNVAITYNGVSMTLIDSQTNTDAYVYLYYIIAPPTGANNVAATWTGSANGWLKTRTYSGVHQTTAIGTSNKASGTSTAPLVVVTSATGELVVDFLTAHVAITAVGAGHTSRYNESTVVNVSGSDVLGETATNCGWTLTSSSTWAIIGVPLKPAAAVNSGNGAVYYNNYLYRAKTTDINRYGPLDNSPSTTGNVWTGTTLGSQPSLINTTYPTVGGVSMPNHPMHVHGDNKLYIGDYNTVANPGKGVIHYIRTTKTTNEGDTDSTSTNDALALPLNFLPTDIESYGVDLVISAIQTTSATINQGRAALFFWDTTSTTFYRGPIYVADPLITAMKSVNGELYVWSGNSTRGCRLSKYIGGDSLQEIMFIEDSPPPLAGAIESWGSRIAWGGSTSYPVTRGVVYSYGSKDQRLGKSLMIPIISTAGSTTPLVTSILNHSHLSFVRPKMIVGWGNGTTYGIDKLSTTATYDSVWRSELFSVDNNFSNKRIRLQLSSAVASNMSIVPKIYYDNFQTTVVLPTISTTLYSGQKKILYQALELDSLSAKGTENFCVELNFAGTAEVAVGLPILVDVEEDSDENSQ